MKRIVSWAAIVLLAFSVYLNVFLTLGDMEQNEPQDQQNTRPAITGKNAVEKKADPFLHIRPRLPYKANREDEP